MTKAELLNNAKRIQAAAQELLDKTSVLKTDIGNSLQAAKRHESKLISKERAAEAERREKEKAERLIEYLNSDEQRGVYVSDRDSAAGNAAQEFPAAGIPTVGMPLMQAPKKHQRRRRKRYRVNRDPKCGQEAREGRAKARTARAKAGAARAEARRKQTRKGGGTGTGTKRG